LISTSSTERFLRSKIDARFPDLLRGAALGLEQWYSQRELDIVTFASSATLRGSLSRRDPDASNEAESYLAYVREGFPLYRSLFILDPDAEVRVSVGGENRLSRERLEQLAGIDRPTVSDVFMDGGEAIQFVSTPFERGESRIGTLHAVIAVESIGSIFAEQALGEGTGLYVVGRSARVFASSPGARERERLDPPLPLPGSSLVVEDYSSEEGEHFVGSTLSFRRFGWMLVVEQDYEIAFAPVVTATSKVLAINLGIVVAFGLLALVIARSITKPLGALSDAARRIAQGEIDVEIPQGKGQDEIGVLARALHGMVERLQRNQLELQRKQGQIERANADLTRANQDLHRNNETLEQLSFTDGLTRLHNHRYFQDRLRIEAKRSDRSQEPLALLLLDIDDFKLLNDRHGHAVGDEVLRRVGTMLNNTVRETDLPARYGGEEFAVLAPRTDVEGAVLLGEKVRAVVSRARFLGIELTDSNGLDVTVSVGVSVYAGDAKRFFNEADRALYQAKGSGKDCVIVFES
jgi:diguanylate cyclase (GGDEF)-like protein